MATIAISCEGPSLDDPVDPRFGRAAGFIIIEPDTLAFEYLDNGGAQTMSQGAGIQAAETVSRSGARVVLTGYVGPKAFQTLQALGVEVVQDIGDVTVRQALHRYLAGDTTVAQQPNRARGHWA